MSPWMQSAQNRAQTLGEIFPALADLLAYVAVEFDFERTLPGPTGELNRLRSEPRGSFIFMSDDGDSDNYRAYVVMALLTGNMICLVDNPNLAARLTLGGVPDAAVYQAKDLGAAWKTPRVSGVAYSGPRDNARALNREIAARDGGILQFVWRDAIDPHLALRFVTERTLTINTAAIGGNADLLGIGGGH